MAQIKGEFLADFSSFYEAVQKAEASLDGFETNAAKVGRAFDAVVNSFSGTKIVQQATIATEAIKALGGGTDVLAGATKLTAAEQAKLNATLTEAIAKYNALGQEAPADMVALQKATTQTAKSAEDLSKAVAEPPAQGKAAGWMTDFTNQVTGMATGMISAQAVIGAFQGAWSGLVSFIGSSVAEFAEAEAVNKRLGVALEGLNQATPRTRAYMSDLADSFSNTTKYSGDLITEMEALLVQIGQVLPADMKGALTAATDLASGLGIDLETATQAVAKGLAGNSDALKKFGIDINDARLQAEGMPYVLEEINKRFGGQAQAEMDTYAGKVEALGNKWDDFKESIGEIIVSSPILAAALDGIANAITNSETGITDLDHGLSSLLDKFNAFGSMGTLPDAIRQLEDFSIALNEANWIRKQFESEPVSENTSIRLGTAADQARIQATVNEELKKGAEANKAKEKADNEAASAAKAHAQAVESLRDKLTGDGAIAQANLYVEALRGVKDLSGLTATAQKDIADNVWKGIEAYRTAGKEVPAALREIYAGVMAVNSIKITAGLDSLPGLKVEIPNVTEMLAKFNAEQKKAAEAAAAFQKETDGMVQAYIDMQYGAEAAGKAGRQAGEDTAAGMNKATAATVQLNAALGANKTALDSVLAGHELMNAYRNAGVAMGSQLATGGYNQSMRQRSGVPTSQDVFGYAPGQQSTAQWGNNNSLTVNVNNADAQGIASKLVSEMKHNGYRF